MLALTRRPGESILIYPSEDIDPDMTVAELFKDGHVRFHVSDIQHGQVRIGIDAPGTLTILRAELEANSAP